MDRKSPSAEPWEDFKSSLKANIDTALEQGSEHAETLKIMKELLEEIKISTSMYDILDKE